MIKSKKFINFGKPYIGNKETKFIQEVLKSKWIGTGPIVQKFEKNFSKYKKSKFSISVNSCTAALHLSIMTLGLKKGDEIITTPMTFCSTINSILLAGGKPVLVDIRPDTLNLNEELIEKSITKKTKFILPVHFAGMPCDMTKILKIAKKHNLKIIEDAAQGLGVFHKKKHVGTISIVLVIMAGQFPQGPRLEPLGLLVR